MKTECVGRFLFPLFPELLAEFACRQAPGAVRAVPALLPMDAEVHGYGCRTVRDAQYLHLVSEHAL